MKKVSLRDFRLKANVYINELPIILTVYDKPVATVNTFSESVNTIAGKEEKSVNASTMPVENDNVGWCELHFEKGVTYPRKLITWEDESGNPVISKKWACPKCIERYENKGVGRVYYL